MEFKTAGDLSNPVILFFHAMGVVGDSSQPIANELASKYYCILPTSSVYCLNQEYYSKENEVEQIQAFLKDKGIQEIELIVASSLGADLAMAFIVKNTFLVKHVFFDGGQFAQIGKTTRKIMVPFLYGALKSLFLSKGKTLKKLMWCDDDSIKPYFIEAGKNLKYKNLKKQMSDSLENKPFPKLSKELQEHTFFEFGNQEDHFKYREAVMKAYPYGHYPIFDGYNHMQYQICDPKGFANMLECVIENNHLPTLPFVKKD